MPVFDNNQFQLKQLVRQLDSVGVLPNRARALPLKLFRATLLVFLQPAYLPIVGCGR